MADISKLKQNVGQIDSIKQITQAMADIATAQIKQRRRSAELNIKYFQEIFSLYHTVKQIALKTSRYQETLRRKNGKTVIILITSDYKFNGDLDLELTNFFLVNSARTKADRIVIGTSGKELIKTKHVNFEFRYVDFKQDFPSIDELEGLVDMVFPYSKILVYHSRFITLLNQEPTVTDITATEEIENQIKTKSLNFLLEPEIDKMITFFEDQMLLLLLQAIFLESEIARIAARMVSMNHAEQEAEKLLKIEQKTLFSGRKANSNMKIVENYASFTGGK